MGAVRERTLGGVREIELGLRRAYPLLFLFLTAGRGGQAAGAHCQIPVTVEELTGAAHLRCVGFSSWC